jgi:hypothetical protein
MFKRRRTAGSRRPEGLVSTFLAYVTAHPGLLVFTTISAVLVAYLLYAMIYPTKF